MKPKDVSSTVLLKEGVEIPCLGDQFEQKDFLLWVGNGAIASVEADGISLEVPENIGRRVQMKCVHKIPFSHVSVAHSRSGHQMWPEYNEGKHDCT
ncbi:MAG: hypothetical protein V4438_00035 [Patescibacteria group bacterium]